MTCVKCKEEFKPEVVRGDDGTYTLCPNCGAQYAIVKTAKCTRAYLVTDAVSDPYSKAEDIDDENENWR